MNKHKQLIESFYKAFEKRDVQGMIKCYHPEIEFYDPVFQTLKGDEAKAMWRMLCEGADSSIKIVASNIIADDKTGSAHWEAEYKFSQTGRPVHNKIDAVFKFKDQLISQHTDSFDLWRWSAMALGLKGSLLGWTPFMQNAIRSQAQGRLKKYISKQK